MCEKFHALPYEGGLLEQPAGVLIKMEKVLDAKAAIEEKQANREAAQARISGAKNV